MLRSTAAVLALTVVLLAVASSDAQAFGRRHAKPAMDVVLVVDDPCDCCGPQEVCACVPCCCTEPPCVSWRDGVFGRRVATYSWACCGYELDVVVTRRGELIVR